MKTFRLTYGYVANVMLTGTVLFIPMNIRFAIAETSYEPQAFLDSLKISLRQSEWARNETLGRRVEVTMRPA